MKKHPNWQLFTVLLGLFVCCFSAKCVFANVIQKETVSYFKFEKNEYPLDADGKLSDLNARDILCCVKRIYEEVPPMTEENFASLCDIRDNLRRVYGGEVYEEILLTCIKTCANYAIYLQQEPSSAEYPKKVPDRDTFFYGGRMVRVETSQTTGQNVQGSTLQFISFNCVLIERQRKEGDAALKNDHVRWGSHVGGGAPPYNEEVVRIKPYFEQDALPGLFDEAAENLAAFLESFIASLQKNGNRRSIVIEEQLDPVLKGIPIAIYEKKAKDHPEVSKMLASKLISICLEYMNSDKAKGELKDFASKSGIEYKEPEVKEKKMF
jgi:hypothetical protein